MIGDSTLTVLVGTGEGWWRILSKPCDGAEELGAEDSQEDSLLMIGYWSLSVIYGTGGCWVRLFTEPCDGSGE